MQLSKLPVLILPVAVSSDSFIRALSPCASAFIVAWYALGKVAALLAPVIHAAYGVFTGIVFSLR
jgi:hypothetical protein